jgi:hypothetical protein
MKMKVKVQVKNQRKLGTNVLRKSPAAAFLHKRSNNATSREFTPE